eukprot:gnl/Chilomastix_cuspidata/1289.p1 GENE.gnl/Chilomastix_cuspidata/1289~~gnl/Chilomastix_cuspidata/1289.p1  ORF type:complete len:801 (-),score=324.81 gnl/Chilomastix_cuspidata/1289:34-2436(-)
MELPAFLRETEAAAPPRAAEITALAEAALARPGAALSGPEALEVLALAGIAVPEHVFMPVTADAAEFAKTLGDKEFIARCVLDSGAPATSAALAHGINARNLGERIPELVASQAEPVRGVLLFEAFDYFSADPATAFLRVEASDDETFGKCLALHFCGPLATYLRAAVKHSKQDPRVPLFVDPASRSFANLLSGSLVAEVLAGTTDGLPVRASGEALVAALAPVQRLQRFFSAQNSASRYIIEDLSLEPCVVARGSGAILPLGARFRVAPNPSFGKEVHLFSTPKALWKINSLLKPKTVVIAGASSRNAKSPASIVLKSFVDSPAVSNDAIFPLHPAAPTLFGLPAYKSLDDVCAKLGGEKVDLLVCGVRASVTEQMATHAIEKNLANAVYILTGGFGETEGGRPLEDRIRAVHQAQDPRERPVINGPNTLGNICEGFSNTVFTPAIKSSRTGRGVKECALICQSGAFMVSRLSDVGKVVSPSLAVSVGNQLDLSAVDFLDFLMHDKDIHQVSTFGLYIEGLKSGEGARLMHLVAEAREKGKLVVIYKAGRTPQGVIATASHTASSPTDFLLFEKLLTAAGAVVTKTLMAFDRTIMCGTIQPRLVSALRAIPRGEKVVVGALSNAGFEKCAVSDHLFAHPADARFMTFPDLVGKHNERFRALYKELRLEGVVDVSDVLDTTPMIPDAVYSILMRAVYEVAGAHVGLVSPVPETNAIRTIDGTVHTEIDEDIRDPKAVTSQIIQLARDFPSVPTFAIFESGWKYDATVDYMCQQGVPTFRRVDESVRVLAAIVRAVRGDLM